MADYMAPPPSNQCITNTPTHDNNNNNNNNMNTLQDTLTVTNTLGIQAAVTKPSPTAHRLETWNIANQLNPSPLIRLMQTGKSPSSQFKNQPTPPTPPQSPCS